MRPDAPAAENEQHSSASAVMPAGVVIVGGGFAALEAAIALRAVAGERVKLTLISPNPRFAYRPAAAFEPFADRPPLAYELREIAIDLGATYHRVGLEAVAPQ